MHFNTFNLSNVYIFLILYIDEIRLLEESTTEKKTATEKGASLQPPRTPHKRSNKINNYEIEILNVVSDHISRFCLHMMMIFQYVQHLQHSCMLILY